MKAFTKLLLVGAVAGAGYMVYRQRMASRAEDDLWSEATNAPDLSSAYKPVFDTPAPDKESPVQAVADKTGAAADKVSDTAAKTADKVADKADAAADKVSDTAQKTAGKAADAADGATGA
jgi:hypothetical protein